MSELNSPFSLAGKTAIVTGGASGIGLAVAGAMVKAGAKVVAVGTRPAEQAEPALAPFGSNVRYHAFDITDEENAPGAAAELIELSGSIDILVNNAGSHCKKSVEDMTMAEFRRVLEVNLIGSFSLTKALVPHLKSRGGGSILFMASMASFIGLSNTAGYCSAKSGLLGLVRNLAVDLYPDGVRVNAIAPGWIDTPMFRKAVQGDPQRMEKILDRIPGGKPGRPEDVGYAAVYLASDAARYVNGICLPVDGGALVNL